MAKDEIGPVAGIHRADRGARHHDRSDRRACARRCERAQRESLGRRDRRDSRFRSRCSWAAICKWIRPHRVLEATAMGLVLLIVALYVGRAVAENPELAPMFTLNRNVARDADHGVRLPRVGAAGVAAARAARLPLGVREARRRVRAGARHSRRAAAAARCRRSRGSSTARGPVFAGKLFPFAFITIACGAISGFHALVSSGTTPKLLEQRARRADDRLRRHAARVVGRDAWR